jgi:ubiquinone/menaquinone biosynthesis C-methylase UbiE
VLRTRVPRLTCVESDRRLADKLRRRLDPSVCVRCDDAMAMSLPDESFDGAVCFTMLHHVPSVAKQDRLLRDVARVLRPGGLFAGTDSLYIAGRSGSSTCSTQWSWWTLLHSLRGSKLRASARFTSM